jgi:predicted dehydrogenase
MVACMKDIAVIGAGYWGQNLVRNVAALGRLGMVCDEAEGTRTKMRALYPAVNVCAELDEVLQCDGIRGVMIAVPSKAHAEVARLCLEAGKHVYVEKPITLDVSEADALCDLADARERQLMVGHLLLFHPCVRWIRQAVEEGRLGDVLYLNSMRVNLGKVRSDENAMWSLAPHDISVAMYLLGAEPETVAAHGLCYVQKERNIHDVVFITLRFPDGTATQIHVSWLDPHKKRQLTVVGRDKMLTFDDVLATEKIRVFDKGVTIKEGLDAPSYDSYGDFLSLRQGDILIPHIPMREPLRELCTHFIDCVDRNVRPLTDGRSGAAVLRVLAAAQQSLDSGGHPVSMLEGS